MGSRRKLDIQEIINLSDVSFRRTLHHDKNNVIVPVVFCSFKGLEVKTSGLPGQSYRFLEMKAFKTLKTRFKSAFKLISNRLQKVNQCDT